MNTPPKAKLNTFGPPATQTVAGTFLHRAHNRRDHSPNTAEKTVPDTPGIGTALRYIILVGDALWYIAQRFREAAHRRGPQITNDRGFSMVNRRITAHGSAAASAPRKVTLLIETDRAYGRGILHGISRWTQMNRNWVLSVQPRVLDRSVPRLSAEDCDGVIARVTSPAAADAVRRLAVPAVVLSYEAAPHHVCVGTRSTSEGRLAAEYFLDRGFGTFAFCGVAEQFSRERLGGFAACLAEHRHAVHEYPRQRSRGQGWWAGEHGHLARWLATLPKPVAVFAATDDVGRRVLAACQWRCLRVPDQVAVLGVDNDELLCELCTPPLSSIALDTDKAGFEAAAALEALMAGREPSQRSIVVEPLCAITRQSTDVLAVEDHDVALAIRYIREHAHERIGVRDVVRHVPASRRSLECRFKRLRGRTLHDELLHARVERAKHLLATSQLSMPQVAKASGFSSADYMRYVFRRTEGLPPLSYRKRHGPRG